MDAAKNEVEQICAKIRHVLVTDWDPIGVMDDPDWPRGEYDRYVGEILGFLTRRESVHFLARHLCFVEITQMGLGTPSISARLDIARKLAAIDVHSLSSGASRE